jgi:hypothetical protein
LRGCERTADGLGDAAVMDAETGALLDSADAAEVFDNREPARAGTAAKRSALAGAVRG